MTHSLLLHPLLQAQLETLGLSAAAPPEAEAWQAFLESISQSYEEQHRGALILDRNFDNMIRHAADAFFIHDTRGRLRDCNQAAVKMLGYEREELLQLSVADFELELAPGAIWDDMTVDQVFTVQGTHRRKDGSTYPTETRVGAFMIDGEKVIIALCRDITERKQAEEELKQLNRELVVTRNEALAASQSKSTFLANMSHELRTPLNAIIGYSEFLIETMEDEGDETYLDDQRRIRTAGHHLLSLIDNILDLSKIEAGRVEVEIHQFDLAQLLRDIESTVQPLATKNDNRFVVESKTERSLLCSDATKLRQILLNLLGNACKFTSGGEVRLLVGESEDGTRLRFSVSDTGVGMTPEELAIVFEAFQQADLSTTRRFGGTGLGLAITRHYCQLLKGTIDVQSAPGEGTTFTVQLPVDLGGETLFEEPPEPDRRSGVDADLSTPPVLVIEDDESARDLLARVLKNDGYAVALAANGREGLEMARQHKPLAITLDLLMPERDGWQTLHELKNDAELSRIPVIMVSMLDEKKRGFALGADHYLTKPIDHQRLRRYLARYRFGDRRSTALIVEDHEPTRALLARILRDEGWRVVQAQNGAEGLELSGREAPDLVILDLMMPQVDGFEFLRRFRSEKNSLETPVIVCTAKDLTAEEIAQLEDETVRIIEKAGQGAGEILATVRRTLKQLATQ